MLQELIEQHVSWNEEIGEWQLVSISASLHHAPYAVFSQEISQSGSYVPHDILDWVILKMVWVKL